MAEEFLSVLCADITGSDRLHEKISVSEASFALGRYEKRLTQAVERFRGRLAPGIGSQVIAYFPDARDAMQSAVEIQRRVSTLPPLSGVALGVRVSLCVGHAADEKSYFVSASQGNAAVSLLQYAEPGQVMMSVPRRRARGFQWNNRVARNRPGVTIWSGKRALEVFELDWKHFELSQLRNASTPSNAHATLFMHYGGNVHEFNPGHAPFNIGRLASSQLKLKSEKCSRAHARIEYRNGHFLIFDLSTNGTFIMPHGGSEHRLDEEGQVLKGQGHISFGQPMTEGGSETLHFSVSHGIPPDFYLC